MLVPGKLSQPRLIIANKAGAYTGGAPNLWCPMNWIGSRSILDSAKRFARGKHSSLVCRNVSDEEAKYYITARPSTLVFGVPLYGRLLDLHTNIRLG